MSVFLRNSELSLTKATVVNSLFISVGKPKKLKNLGNSTLLLTTTSTLFDKMPNLGFIFTLVILALESK